jgi:hypothetical protein
MLGNPNTESGPGGERTPPGPPETDYDSGSRPALKAAGLRDDQDVPADVLDRVLAPPAALSARDEGAVGEV